MDHVSGKKEIIEWHRLFGLSLIDYFFDKPFEVELERDMSVPQQFLDVMIIEKKQDEKFDTALLCDGFETLNTHNLLTYKSQHEPLDEFALQELIGHYVSYRKMKGNETIDEREINLYAVCVRFPEKLAGKTEIEPIRTGVFQIHVLGLTIEIMVLNQINTDRRNAILNYFSNDTKKVEYAFNVYREHVTNVSAIFHRLLKKYIEEGLPMPLTIDSWFEENIEWIASEIPVDIRLKGVSIEDRIKGLNAEDRIKGLNAEDRIKGLNAEDRIKGLNAEDLAKSLSTEQIEALFKRYGVKK